MKTRQGFVSNSSSSSFCIYGKYFDKETVLEAFKCSPEDHDIYDIKFPDGLECHYNSDVNDNVAIGRSFSTIKDDETGKQFKEGVEKAIEKLFGEKKECSEIEEAW